MKLKNRSIDIIWPYYKDRKFLQNSINQINEQTLQPKRLILIDDLSNEKNLKNSILQKLNKNIKLIVIKNKINYGVTHSISLGYKKIKSKYLYIQSTDDIIYNNFFEININTLEKNPKSSYVFSNIGINNLTNNKKYFIDYSFIKKEYLNKFEVDLLYDEYQFKIFHNTVIFDTKKFLQSNIFNNNYGRRADMLNLQYLSMKYGFCYVKKVISEFTFRKDQLSSSILNNEYLIDELKFLKKNNKIFYKFFIKNNLHYEVSIFKLFEYYNLFGKTITFKYFFRSMKFKLWKKFRFSVSPKLLNIFFKFLS
tara:strand:- start:675 stop:1601 length:927 start_codon:yes stop_codon:yes gene_type:complete